MGEREDRIVHVCGCADDPINRDEGLWDDYYVAKNHVCGICHQPVQAINIDRLLRDRAKLVTAVEYLQFGFADGRRSDDGRALCLSILKNIGEPLSNSPGIPDNSSRRVSDMQHMRADMREHNPSPCDGSCADWDAECGGGCDG